MVRLLARTPLARSQRFARAVAPVECVELIGLGSDYGGHAVPRTVVGRDSIVYSAGVGNDITFDLALIEHFGCTVHAFDPTPSAARHVERAASEESRFRFHPWAIWSSDTELQLYAPDYSDSNYSAINLHRKTEFFTASARSLFSVMAELKHERLDLLKLDIEGAEYEVISSMIADRIPVTALCVEFHKNPSIKDMKLSIVALRAAGFVPVHVDGFDVTLVGSAALQPGSCKLL
jgi:FkbM family methyltransferase